jgi:cytochrome b
MAGSPFDQRSAAVGNDAMTHEEVEHKAEEENEEGEEDERLEHFHEIAANLLLVLAALHVAGVALESRLAGRNLVWPMLSGKASDERH